MKLNKRLILTKIKLVSEQMKNIRNDKLEEKCKIGIIDINNWEWAQGVGIYGMYRYYEETEDASVLEWITNWIDRNLEKGLPERNINTTAPLYTVAHTGERLNSKCYMELCKDWADWIMNDLPKTKYNGFQHVVSDGPNYMQLWDDTLFMTVLFLAKMGVVQQNKKYIEECEHQFLLHALYLQERKTGLWYHGWTFDGNHNFANALWGRGNCWITAFIPDYIEMTGVEGSFRLIMTNILNAQAEALERLQHESGLWHTLLDDPDSYTEVSATAGFAYGILKSIRLGILHKKYMTTAIKAAEAVVKNINDDGLVLNVSYGTGMGKTLQGYKDVPLCPMAYGQAMVIMMLSELLKHSGKGRTS